jgi:phytoene dehydrogenase-like protein
MEYDIIVIGSGHNGLTTACYLAKWGLKVIVLEKRNVFGGGCITEEVTLPGFKHDIHSENHLWVRISPTMDELQLEKYGLEYYIPEKLIGSGFPDGSSIVQNIDIDKTLESISKINEEDADSYKRFYERYLEVSKIIFDSFFLTTPPGTGFMQAMEGSREGAEILRYMLLSPKDVLDENFKDDRVKTWLYAYAEQLGNAPDEPGSGFSIFLLPSFVQQYGLGKPIGGSGMLTEAFLKCFKSLGGEVRGNSEVRRIIIEGGGASGVELISGEKIRAKKAIVSMMSFPYLIKATGEENLGYDFVKRANNFRYGYGIFMVHAALDDQLNFISPELDDATTITLYESMDNCLKCFHQISMGEIPWDNILVFVSNYSVKLCEKTKKVPHGKATLYLASPECIPNTKNLRNGTWDYNKVRFGEALINKLSMYAPNLKDILLKVYFDSPADIERRNPTMAYGDAVLGRSTLEQFLMRPFPGYTEYKTSISNLYMTGGHTWPSGGVTTAPGYNCARIIKRDLKIGG